MNNNAALDVLNQQLQKLLLEKEQMLAHFDEQINNLEDAIDRLGGKHSWNLGNKTLYDDIHPDYIKGSQEEI